MPKISYTLIVKEKGADDSKAWKEHNIIFAPDSVVKTATQHANNTINYFNNTLMPHENARVFMGVENINIIEFDDEEE